MEQRRLGKAGLMVSAVGLGTMTWGRDTESPEAAEQLTDFIEAGGTLVDTAGSYGHGLAEQLLGGFLHNLVSRDDLVLCTKSGTRRTRDGSVVDASRGNLISSLDASLSRLSTDHVDLWLVSAPDYGVDIEETVSALRVAVESGRTRYVGFSNHPAWLTAQAATLLGVDGIGMAATEMEYSLLERGIERDIMPAAHGLGFGLLAWSPLGRGVLTGKYRNSIPADSRAATVHLAGFVQPYLTTKHATIVEAVATAAEGLDRTPTEVALAWCRDQPGVTSAVVGARTAAQLRGSLSADSLILPDQIRDALDDISSIETGYPERW